MYVRQKTDPSWLEARFISDEVGECEILITRNNIGILVNYMQNKTVVACRILIIFDAKSVDIFRHSTSY